MTFSDTGKGQCHTMRDPGSLTSPQQRFLEDMGCPPKLSASEMVEGLKESKKAAGIMINTVLKHPAGYSWIKQLICFMPDLHALLHIPQMQEVLLSHPVKGVYSESHIHNIKHKEHSAGQVKCAFS